MDAGNVSHELFKPIRVQILSMTSVMHARQFLNRGRVIGIFLLFFILDTMKYSIQRITERYNFFLEYIEIFTRRNRRAKTHREVYDSNDRLPPGQETVTID